jgi:signal peptidase II
MAAKTRIFLVALVLALGLDQLTKYWVIGEFHYGERSEVIPGLFELTHVRNPGGAFSFFADGPVFQRMLFFVGMTSVAIVLLLVFFRRLEPQARLTALALGGILGGALGNLIDRLVHQEVIDFLDFHVGSYYWPTFNLADSFIVVGVGFLLVEMFFEEEDDRAGVAASEPPAP